MALSCSLPKSDYGLGLLFILIVAIIWVSASFVTQGLLQGGMPSFVLTYVSNSLFIIYLPIFFVYRWWSTGAGALQDVLGSAAHEDDQRKILRALHEENRAGAARGPSLGPSDRAIYPGSARAASAASTASATLSGGSSGSSSDLESRPGEADATDPLVRKRTLGAKPSRPAPDPAASWRQTAHAAAFVCPIWFMAQLTFNASLSYTSVTSNTILSSTASLYTFAFAVMMGRDKFTSMKLISILLSMIGVVLVTLSDKGTADPTTGKTMHGGGTRADNDSYQRQFNSLEGDALCLMSALTYALYTLAIKDKLSDDHHASMALFFGFMGLFTLLGGLPLLLLGRALHFFTLEGVTTAAVGVTVLKGLTSNVLSDYLWARAVLLVGPTVATVGLALQVPIAVVFDFFALHVFHVVSPQGATGHKSGAMKVVAFFGAAAVLAGFFGINLEEAAAANSAQAID